MHIRLTPEQKEGGCFLCDAEGPVLSFFVQVGDSHVAQTWEVCAACLVKHHIVVVLDELDDRPKKSTPKTNKKASIKQENKLAAAIGGIRHRGSGNKPWAKGDVRKQGDLRGEAKQTRAKSYRITRQELNKIRGECAPDEDPFVAIWFCDTNWKAEDKWVLVPEAIWRRLKDAKR